MRPDYYAPESPFEPCYLVNTYGLNFNMGNVLKYVLRAGRKTKSPIEDLKKASQYCSFQNELWSTPKFYQPSMPLHVRPNFSIEGLFDFYDLSDNLKKAVENILFKSDNPQEVKHYIDMEIERLANNLI